jgi:hypothetical protein
VHYSTERDNLALAVCADGAMGMCAVQIIALISRCLVVARRSNKQAPNSRSDFRVACVLVLLNRREKCEWIRGTAQKSCDA